MSAYDSRTDIGNALPLDRDMSRRYYPGMRYKDKILERCYVGFQRFAADPTSELYWKRRDGVLIRRHGASHRNAFWHGFDGHKVGGRMPYVRQSQAWAIYMAGREFAKKAPEWVPTA